jgi:hypothetical protein
MGHAVRIAFVVACTGCSATTEVARVTAPADAVAAQSPSFKPAAILRDGQRIALGEKDEVSLREGDRVEMRGSFGEGDAVPGGGHVESSRPVGALIAGVTLFTMAYAPSAYAASQTNDKWLFAPVVGPWIDLATRPACTATAPLVNGQALSLPIDPCLGDNVARAMIIASGAIQGLGALITLIALPAHAHHVEKRFAIVPTGLGASAFGTF